MDKAKHHEIPSLRKLEHFFIRAFSFLKIITYTALSLEGSKERGNTMVRVHGELKRTPQLERAVAEVIKILREAERKEKDGK